MLESDMPNYALKQCEVYMQFGLAAEKSQCLEMDAGNLILAWITLFIPTERLDRNTAEWFQQILDDVNRRTLGNLLRLVKTMGTVDQSIQDSLEVALKKRNYLMHRFFSAHNFAIYSDEGRHEMVKELQEIQAIFDYTSSVLKAMARALDGLSGRESPSPKLLEKLVSEGKQLAI